jgi:hypothetical protein
MLKTGVGPRQVSEIHKLLIQKQAFSGLKRLVLGAKMRV